MTAPRAAASENDGDGDDGKEQPAAKPHDPLFEFTTAVAAADRALASASRPTAKKRPSRTISVRFPSAREQLTEQTVKLRDKTQTTRLRLLMAKFAVIAVSVQLVVANALFFIYLMGWAGEDVETPVIIAWLSATVVEIVGIVGIVAQGLFPLRGRRRPRAER